MDIIRDVSYAIRQSCRHPGVPIVVILSLGCAMGISTSLFSVVNAMWFAPWSVRGAELIRIVRPDVPSDQWRFWVDHSQAFSGLAAQRSGAVRVGGQMVFCDFVSANYFQVLNVPMLVGQGFEGHDDASSEARHSAIISHHLWRARFGEEANVIGRLITLEHIDSRQKALSFTIVGVAPPGFEGPDNLRRQVWLPLSAIRQFQQPGVRQNDTPRVRVFGRLAPGISAGQAQAELSKLRRQFLADQVSPSTTISLHSTDRYSQAELPFQSRVMINALMVGITFVTLIACANASNLLLARGHQRRGETALRLALGATRVRVLRQLLIESFLLCVIAGCMGVILSLWLPDALFQGLVRNTSRDLAELVQPTFPLDLRVFTWALGVSTVACVVFGLGPALRCSQVDMGEVIKESHGASKRGLMPSILSYQTIVSVMALGIAGLMLRSAPVAEAARIGDSAADVTFVRLDLSEAVHVRQREQLIGTIAERLGSMSDTGTVAGLTGQMQAGVSQTLHVTGDYFDVLRITWISGRTFAPSDPGARVMVVNEPFSHHFWPNQTSIGAILNENQARVWDKSLIGRQVIGVVHDAQLSMPTAYVPAEPKDVQVLLARVGRNRVLRELPTFVTTLPGPVNIEILSGSEWIAPVVGLSLLAAWLSIAFGSVALALGTMGFFSLLDYAVQQRTREIGIRRALGAQPRHIIRSLIEPTARPLVRGLLIGSAGTIVAGIVMRQADLPSGINPLDPAVYAAVAAALSVAGVLASYGPARRAIRIEPSKALRIE